MKTHTKTLFSAGIGLVLTLPSHAAIYFEATSSGDTYTANDALTFVVDPTQGNQDAGKEPAAAGYEGIEVTATSTLDGNNFYVEGGAGGQIIFHNADAITAGQTVTFDFQFNMLLGSGPRPFNATGSAIRAASLFRITSPVDGKLDATITGGNFGSLFSPLPTVGDTTYSNGTTDIGFATTGTYSSLSGDTLTFVDNPVQSQFRMDLFDNTRNIDPADFSFDHISYTFTADSDVAAGKQFRFTFEGTNAIAQQAVIDAAAVPEPASSALLGLSALALILRRKRSAA